MKTKIITLTLINILILSQLFSSEVSEKMAKQVAHNFYFERNNDALHLDYLSDYIDEVYPIVLQSQNVFYFINFKKDGWIAISASDVVIPIIAYSFTGSYYPDSEPDNFNMWISQYKTQVLEAITDNELPATGTKNLWDHYLSDNHTDFIGQRTPRGVEPLIKTTWDQGLYYNEMCPEDSGGPGGNCLTGCVPTCMGQICNYFRFPQSGIGSYSYSCPPYGELSADFGNAFYNWDEMAGNLVENNLETAKLLFHLGVSCDIVYGPDGSGMYNHKAAYALRTHFKYSPETEYLYRDSTSLNWDSVIIAHIDKKIPLYYAGWSVPNINGHAFVCDGYQDDSYFHFNWGWSGSNDGYFHTGNLNPGGSNFNLAQELIINCFPDTVNYQYPLYCSGDAILISASGTIDDGSGPVYDYDNNQECSWLISPVDSVNFILLEFLEFETEAGDTLYLYDGNSINSPLIGAYSGSNIPDNVISSSDEVFIKFLSNNADVSAGWMIGYSSELPEFCINNQIILPQGELSDGSGPANYQNQTMCLWFIQPENAGIITLEFSEFDTEADHDFVTVYDDSEKIAEYSGSDVPSHTIATSGTMTVVFSTNSAITGEGWSATYSSTPVAINESLQNNDVKLYPNPVGNELFIEFNEPYEQLNISVFNLVGKLVYENDVNNLSQIIVNTSDLLPGMYVLEIKGKSTSLTKKVVIKH
jgi:peptidase C10-like protein/CUB-like protein/type IX secretion system substrate protein/Spi protease inhibitor